MVGVSSIPAGNQSDPWGRFSYIAIWCCSGMLGFTHPDSCGMECMTAGPGVQHLRPRRCFDGHYLLLGEDPLQESHPGDDAQYRHCDCTHES